MVKYHRIDESVYAVERNYDKLFCRGWVRLLSDSLLHTKYMDNLQCYISEIYKSGKTIYPTSQTDIFKPFKLTKSDNIKVVIFGDEPAKSIHSNGLAFGAYKQIPFRYEDMLPISKDLKRCLDPEFNKSFEKFDTTLTKWADQGVLLLNTSLISEENTTMKHEYVFRNFIRTIVQEINNVNIEVIFVFTSNHQFEQYSKYIDTDFHSILQYDGIDTDASMFEDINQILEEQRGDSNRIDW